MEPCAIQMAEQIQQVCDALILDYKFNIVSSSSYLVPFINENLGMLACLMFLDHDKFNHLTIEFWEWLVLDVPLTTFLVSCNSRRYEILLFLWSEVVDEYEIYANTTEFIFPLYFLLDSVFVTPVFFSFI